MRRISPKLRMRAVGVAALLMLPLSVAPAAAATPVGQDHRPPPEARLVPPADCAGPVPPPTGRLLPGYLAPDERGGQTCVAFKLPPLEPPGYRGDYRVDEFTFAKAEQALAACRAAPTCPAMDAARGYRPPQFRQTGTLDPVGRIDPHAQHADLAGIRRPAYFARAPYAEPIAAVDAHTHTVDFVAPTDPYDRYNLGIAEPLHLRGWYLRGAGVAPWPGGPRRHALIVLLGGRSIETTTTEDPADTRRSEKPGSREWRSYLLRLNQAGFDVLTFDKRGHGISGGRTADNAFEQGLDMLRALDALGSGQGLRVLDSDHRELSGPAAVRAVVGSPGAVRTMPVVLGGSSQGSWATEWAMTANRYRWCSFDLPGKPCHRPWGYRNVRGAVLLANLWGAPFGAPDGLAAIAADAQVNHFMLFPTSEPLAGVGGWPALFIGKGIFDDIDGPFPAYDAYRRAGPHREIVLLRSGHSEVFWGRANIDHVQDRLIRYATAAAFDRDTRRPVLPDLRAAVRDSPPQ